MKGYKTIIFNALSAAIPVILTNLSNVDWTQYVDPTTAILIMAVINGVLRTRTNTPIFKKEAK